MMFVSCQCCSGGGKEKKGKKKKKAEDVTESTGPSGFEIFFWWRALVAIMGSTSAYTLVGVL